MVSKERPILFSTEMVRAILDGRKTQTRRVVKPQPSSGVRKSIFVASGLEDGHGEEIKVTYHSGDILWVRETWCYGKDTHSIMFDPEPMPESILRKADIGECDRDIVRWRPSIFMPREAARLFLTVKNVRLERLQDISSDDAWDEGVKDPYEYQDPSYYDQICFSGVEIKKCAFAGLWDSINAKRGYGWGTNPWVWVIEFERR